MKDELITQVTKRLPTSYETSKLVVLCLFCFVFVPWPHPTMLMGLFLALRSRNTHGSAQ